MPNLTLPEWNRFLTEHPEAHILQSGEWGELKSAFGWEAVRLAGGGLGAQILFRRLPLGLTFAYIPKGPVGLRQERRAQRFWSEVDRALPEKTCRLPESGTGWLGRPSGRLVLLRRSFLASPQHIQPAARWS